MQNNEPERACSSATLKWECDMVMARNSNPFETRGIRYNKFRKKGTAGSKNRGDKAAAVW
jgi:hypothetical protein